MTYKKISTMFLILVIVGFVSWMFYNSWNRKNQIKKNMAITSGYIYNIVSYPRGGTFFQCKFQVEEETLYRSFATLSELEGSAPWKLIGHSFPVVYSSKDPNYCYLLVTPSDFERFRMAFPDSLYWVRQYLGR